MKKIIICLIFIFTLVGCNKTVNIKTISFFKFNTYITVTIPDNKEQFDDIFQIYNTYDYACNYYVNNEGNLNDLNSRREIVALNELIEVIEYALSIDYLGEAFSIYLGTINNMWSECIVSTEKTLPSSELIETEIEKSSNTSVVINGNNIKLNGESNIDLGSVAKGYATLKVHEYLIENNISNYIVNAGSSNILLGSSNSTVGVKYPFVYNGSNFDYSIYYEYVKKMSISNKAVVSSSIEYQSFYSDDILYSHIINPLTGYSKNSYDSITLIGDCSATLDILSTAFFNLEIIKIKEICNTLNIECIILKDLSILYESDGVINYEEKN